MVQAVDKAQGMTVVEGGKGNKVSLADAVKSVARLEKELQVLFPERDEMIRGLVTAFVARQHMVVLGPPGTGKTMLSRTISECFGMTFYSRLITGQTTEDEIFGAPDIIRYQQTGEYVRNTKGRAPEAEVVLYDECFKGNSKLLNANLAFMEERHIENPDVQKCPLVTMIGLSNEPPEDETLEAFWSRFSIRMWVDYVRKPDSRRILLDNALNGGFSPKCRVSAEEVAVLQDAAKSVAVGDEARSMLLECLDAVRAEGLTVTDRGIIQAAMLLKASAAIAGSSTVTEDHFEMLPYCWASDGDDVGVIKRHVTRIVEAKAKALKELAKKVKDYQRQVSSINPDNMQSVVTNGTTLLSEIKGLLEGAGQTEKLIKLQASTHAATEAAWEYMSLQNT